MCRICRFLQRCSVAGRRFCRHCLPRASRTSREHQCQRPQHMTVDGKRSPLPPAPPSACAQCLHATGQIQRDDTTTEAAAMQGGQRFRHGNSPAPSISIRPELQRECDICNPPRTHGPPRPRTGSRILRGRARKHAAGSAGYHLRHAHRIARAPRCRDRACRAHERASSARVHARSAQSQPSA